MKKKLFTLIAVLLICFTATAKNGTGVVTPGQGTEKVYAFSSIYVGYVGEHIVESYKASIVWGSNGHDVWFDNMFPRVYLDADFYVHGTTDGKKITIAKQFVCKDFYSSRADSTMDVYVVPVVKDKEGKVSELESFTMSVSDNGDVVIDQTAQGDTVYVYLMGLTPDGHISEVIKNGRMITEDVCDLTYLLRYELLSATDYQKVEIPSSVTMDDYILTYEKDVYGRSDVRKTKVGFDGNDVYLKNFSLSIDSAVVKGRLSANGDTITIPNGQYLGLDEGRMLTYNSAVFCIDNEFYTSEYRPTVFVKDDKDVWHLAGGLYFSDMEYNDYYIINYYTDATFYAAKPDVADTPQDPYGLEVADFTFVGYPYVDLYFEYSKYGASGSLLNTDKLYFRLYMDGKPCDLAEQGYPEATQYTDGLIPVNCMTENFRFLVPNIVVSLSSRTWQTVGIQLVYVLDGQQYCSNVVNIDHNNNVFTGISPVNASVNVARPIKTSHGIIYNNRKYNFAGKQIK